MAGFAERLYTGELTYPFVRRRRIWYLASGLLALISVISLSVRGINASIDFKGGALFQFPTNHHSVADARAATATVGITDAVVQVVGAGSDQSFQVQTKPLTEPQITSLEHAFETRLGATKISSTTIGPTWGSQITDKAVLSLIVFLVLVIAYLSFRFEPKMAAAAIVALIHDLLITAGIYSLTGFEVSPSTVIALLTILGYSLYDTVVVFDRVRENTAGLVGGSRMTFSDATNLAVNQTLVRSINTSVIALLPVAGLLIIGAGLLGAGSLKDLALALFIGLASGAYSSIFIASPLLCDLKEREPDFKALARRVAARQTKEAQPGPARAAVGVGRGLPAAAPATAGVVGPLPTAAPLGGQPSTDGAPPATANAPSRPRPAPARRKGSRPRKKRR